MRSGVGVLDHAETWITGNVERNDQLVGPQWTRNVAEAARWGSEIEQRHNQIVAGDFGLDSIKFPTRRIRDPVHIDFDL